MIKKLIPLVLTLFIFSIFLSYATFKRTKESSVSSIEGNNNNYIKNDVSTNSRDTYSKSNSSYKNTSNIAAEDTPVVKDENVSNQIQKVDIDIFNYLYSL